LLTVGMRIRAESFEEHNVILVYGFKSYRLEFNLLLACSTQNAISASW
jgi:hypothetical protein